MSFYSRLADVSMEEFKHNNMIPFFGSGIKQNMNENMNQTLMEKYTGVDTNTRIQKNEKNTFSDIERNVFNNDNQGYLTELSRFEKPVFHNNINPTEQIRVGPGNKNTDPVAATGGYQQDTFREFKLYKDVDELRVKTNNKETFEGRFVDGMKGSNRGKIGTMNKNRVDTFFEQKNEDLLKTTGAFLKDKQRPCIDVKEPKSNEPCEYKGIPHKNIGKIQYGAVKESTRKQMNPFGTRNATSSTYGKGNDYDYGKKNILVYNNERDITSTKSYEGNLTTYVKSMIAPFVDVFRRSNKEYFIKNAREFGQLQTTFPKKQTIYNPNDTAKTTIKETLIEDTRTGNLKGCQQITTYDPNDVARTTIKETLLHDSQAGNLQTTTKSIVYNPNEIAKNTIRETLSTPDDTMNLKGNTKQRVHNPNDVAKTTVKETTIDNDILGVASGIERGEGYLTNEFNAKYTNKQFTSDNEYLGNPEQEQTDGYKQANFDAKMTNKQITSDKEHFGVAGNENDAMMSYDDIYNAVINQTREKTLNKPAPTQNNVKLHSGSEFVNLTNIKFPCNNDNTANIEKVYQHPPSKDFVNMTQEKNIHQLESDNRIDPTLLNPFRANPYTHSLNTAV